MTRGVTALATVMIPLAASVPGAVAAQAGSGSGHIAFSRYDEASGEPRIVVADTRGGHERVLSLPMPADDPVWSPTGRTILLFAFPPTGAARPAVVGADGSGFRVLRVPSLPADVDIRCTAWSPYGGRLLCQASRGPGGDPAMNGIYTIRSSDGGDVKRLTTNPYPPSGNFGGGDIPGGFSPDGRHFVFMRAKPGPDPEHPDAGQTGALYVGSTDRTAIRQLTQYGVPNSHDNGLAHWSPDGSRIIFAGADGELLTIRPSGGLTTRIQVDGYVFSPNWSPDGRRIVAGVYREQAGQEDVYTMRADGNQLTQLTDTTAFEDFPDWIR
ncbi:TolB family protein [Kribbella sp. NPDC051586]|uniref:TolB family protein n=1 Tax=Kribbella sp. NPDC051586 TaxID=3364118 RepID=UPI0037ACADD2